MTSLNVFMRLFYLSVIAIQIHQANGFDLTILHTNDVHSRFEQFSKYGSARSGDDAAANKCFGGVARRQTKIKEIRSALDNVLLLDAGDQFLGSNWFTLYRGVASAYFMERLGYDAMCIGNHEFDLGDEALADFSKNVSFPVLSANVEAAAGSSLHGLFMPSTTIVVAGRKVGIVGYTTTDTAMISKPSKNVSFSAVLPAVEAEVGRLTSQGVNVIIALGHAGYRTDQQVAEIDGVDVVIGGHTNTFLYNGETPSNDDPIGPYPAVVTQGSGHRALVVQDYTWAKYLGYLNVTFDGEDVVQSWSGNPVVLDGTIPEDTEFKAMVEDWGRPVNESNSKVVGSSKVFLEGRREICRLQECNMANVFLDSLVDYFLTFPHTNTTWAPAAIALWNAGGIRASIQKGAVTVGDVSTVLPFNNEVDLMVVKGSVLREQLEFSVQDMDPVEPGGRFLHFSGMRVKYDVRRDQEKRVISVDVRCLECDVPSYFPLDDNANYRILMNTFMAAGGDGYDFQPIEHIRFNTAESKVFSSYFERHSPVYSTVEGRITFEVPDVYISGAPSNCVPSVVILGLLCLVSVLCQLR